MKAIIALFLVLAVASAKEHHNFANFLQNLVSLTAKDEIEDVAKLVVEVRQEVQNDLNELERQRDDAEESWKTFVASTTENLNAANQFAGFYQAQLDAANTRQAELQGQISQALGDINEAQASQDAENSRRADAHESFNKVQKGLQEAIQAAKEAKLLLEEASNKDLDSASLLEISTKKVHKHFKDIKSSLKHIKASSEIIPMIEVLVEIASKGVNGEAVGQILDLIDNLILSLEEQLHTAVERENADAEYSTNAVATFQDTIDTETASVNAAQTELTSVEGQISALIEVVKSWNDQAHDLQSQIDQANGDWKSQSDNWDALIARLKKDIKALNQAEDILTEMGEKNE